MVTHLTLTQTQLYALADAEPMAHVLITAAGSSLTLDGVTYLAPRCAS